LKAILVKEHGGPDQLVYEDHHLPDIGPDEVLISVKFAGINFPDTLIIRGKYQFQPELPFAPGGEVSGVIKAVGAHVKDFKIGDRVISGTSWGGFAEEVIGRASNTFLLPDEVPFETGAATLMTYATVIHALKDRAKMTENESLVVLGASGGVGTAAIQISKKIGAKVIACVSSQEKLEYCLALGADHGIIYEVETLKKELKNLQPGGVDVIFDAVGGDFSEQAFRTLKPFGRHLVIGFASGKVPAIPWNLPLLKSASIVGVFWGSFFRNFPRENKENIKLLMDLIITGKIAPTIDRIFPLEQAAEALKLIEEREVKGKVLLAVG
jgi:NADPH2:quinone reductase